MDFPGMHAGENPRWKVSASANQLSSDEMRVTQSLQTAACREYNRGDNYPRSQCNVWPKRQLLSESLK